MASSQNNLTSDCTPVFLISNTPPWIVAESVIKCPTTSAPESDTVNLLVPPCVTCKLPDAFERLLGDSNNCVLPPFQLIPSLTPASLNCKYFEIIFYYYFYHLN